MINFISVSLKTPPERYLCLAAWMHAGTHPREEKKIVCIIEMIVLYAVFGVFAKMFGKYRDSVSCASCGAGTGMLSARPCPRVLMFGFFNIHCFDYGPYKASEAYCYAKYHIYLPAHYNSSFSPLYESLFEWISRFAM